MDNYFNYFTEIERYYQSRRESFTLLSTLDWVLIESWKDQGIPLEVVLKGMDRAFSRAKRKVSSLAYCANAIDQVAGEQKDTRTESPALPEVDPEEVRRYLDDLGRQVRALGKAFPEFRERVDSLAASLEDVETTDMRTGETTLNALEDKLIAIIKVAADEKALVEVQKGVEDSLAPFRSRMTVEQLSMLEGQLRKRKLMERYGIPRLSLFYLI